MYGAEMDCISEVCLPLDRAEMNCVSDVCTLGCIFGTFQS